MSSRSERIVGPLTRIQAADHAATGGRLWLGSILPTSWEEHTGLTGDQPAGRGLAMVNEAGEQSTVPASPPLLSGVLVGWGNPHVGCLKPYCLPSLPRLHLRVRLAPTARRPTTRWVILVCLPEPSISANQILAASTGLGSLVGRVVGA